MVSQSLLKHFLKLSFIINCGLLLGRFLGFLREVIIADGYGATWEADVTITLLTLPDILINILVGGALTAALVPSFIADRSNSKKMAYQASIVLFVIFCAISIVLSWQSNTLVELLAPGYSGDVKTVAENGMAAVVMVLPIFVITGVTSALLQSKEKFTIPSLGTFFFNIVLVAGLLITTQEEAFNVSSIVLIVLIAGVFRYTSQVVIVKPLVQPFQSLRPWLINNDLVQRYWQAMLSGGILFIYPVAARAYASMVEEGGVALFSYAMKLIELPLLFAVSFLGMVLLPRLSKAYINNKSVFSQLMTYGLQAVFVLGVVAVATLFVGRQEYVQVVYGRGLEPESLKEVTSMVAVGLLCVLFQGAITFMTAVFNAARKTKIPLFINVVGGFLLLLLLHLGKGSSLMNIMMNLTVTYAALSFVYIVFIGFSFYDSFDLCNKSNLIFVMSVLIVNVFFAVGHWFLLSLVHEAWLSLMITFFAGIFALIASAFCHKEIRERFLSKGFYV